MENEPRTDATCPFCEPKEGGHNRMLRQNALAYLTLSNPRKAPGHVLVIPKRHIEKAWELTREEIQDTHDLIFFAQKQILQHQLGTGTQVRQNYMPYIAEGTLKVDHVHYHVMPRSENDEIYKRADKAENELFQALPNEERERLEPLFC